MWMIIVQDVSCQMCYALTLLTVWFDLYLKSQAVEQCQRRMKKKNSVSLVFSFKVHVRLDSQSREDERLKEIHKMPSA